MERSGTVFASIFKEAETLTDVKEKMMKTNYLAAIVAFSLLVASFAFGQAKNNTDNRKEAKEAATKSEKSDKQKASNQQTKQQSASSKTPQSGTKTQKGAAAKVQGGPGFVDADGDGICDHAQNRPANGRGRGQGWGRFRNMRGTGAAGSPASTGQSQAGKGRGPGFVDANGDGVCDRLQQCGGRCAGCQGAGSGAGKGRCKGSGPGFVDANGDGICDRRQSIPK
jgi:uncharacterized membrane protein YkoI